MFKAKREKGGEEREEGGEEEKELVSFPLAPTEEGEGDFKVPEGPPRREGRGARVILTTWALRVIVLTFRVGCYGCNRYNTLRVRITSPHTIVRRCHQIFPSP